MAIKNPNNLYTFGAVQLNDQPEVNAYANMMAHQQAKFDALDQYERNRLNTVNDSGLRDQERKILDEGIGDVRSFYNQNKKSIQRGNTPEAFEYEKKFGKLKQVISQSKASAAATAAAMKLKEERFKLDQRLPDDYMLDVHSNDLPVTDPNYKLFDVGKWTSEPKPFVQDKFVKEVFGDIKRTPTAPKYEAIPGQPLKLNEVTSETFDDAAKQTIAARILNKYENSYSFSSEINEKIKDPVVRKRLGDVFRAELKTDPTMPSDYAIAYGLELAQPTISKSKPVDNKEEIMKQRNAFTQKMAAIHQAYTSQNIEHRNRILINDMLATDEKFDQVFNQVGTNLPKNVVQQVFGTAKDEKGHPIGEPEIQLSSDGKTYHFNIYTDGVIDPSKSKIVPVETVKNQMKKDLLTAVKTKANPPTTTKPPSTTKPSIKKDPLGLFK